MQQQNNHKKKKHVNFIGDEDNMDIEDDDVIIPDELQSEDPEALANKDVPPFYVRLYYRIPNYTNKYKTQYNLRIGKSNN